MDPSFWILGALLLLALAVAAWSVRRALEQALTARRDDPALGLLQSQVQATAQQSAQQMEHLRAALQQIHAQTAQSLDGTRKAMDDRLDGAARVISGVSKQLGQLEESTRHLFELGKDISSLQQILKAPKLRGGLGELFLQDLLGQILSWDRFRMQYAFKGGETVDAVILLQGGMVPVDAKFPLENFQRVVQAENDDQRREGKKAFLRDVKKHVDAIAAKYIRPDEGTLDFALMYIPAENVYYETIIKDDEFGGEMALFQFALQKRVIPVSPNSLYAYLHTILLGLKGMRVEESAREILSAISRLEGEFTRFGEAFRLVGRHLDNSAKQFLEADKRFGRVEGKMQEIGGIVKGLDAPALPAAEPPPSDAR
jgi:DNA recombination protein RmuC